MRVHITSFRTVVKAVHLEIHRGRLRRLSEPLCFLATSRLPQDKASFDSISGKTSSGDFSNLSESSGKKRSQQKPLKHRLLLGNLVTTQLSTSGKQSALKETDRIKFHQSQKWIQMVLLWLTHLLITRPQRS